MKAAPNSPSELAAALAAVFPLWPRDLGSSDESVLGDAEATYHSVLREFAYFFSKDLNHFSDRQLQRFAELVARSVATAGPLENAFDTCFLEHMKQLGVESRLRPFLGTVMREDK